MDNVGLFWVVEGSEPPFTSLLGAFTSRSVIGQRRVLREPKVAGLALTSRPNEGCIENSKSGFPGLLASSSMNRAFDERSGVVFKENF